MKHSSRNEAGADQIRGYCASITPLGGVGRLEEIASIALFLASEESIYSTDTDLPVDGGVVV